MYLKGYIIPAVLIKVAHSHYVGSEFDKKSRIGTEVKV